MKRIHKVIVFFALSLIAVIIPSQGFGEEEKWTGKRGDHKMEYIPLVGVTDLRSKFSDGCFTLKTLAEMCIERKIEAMIVMDHDRYSLEYGIFPFRNLLRKKVEKSSLLLNGADSYLRAFENLKYEFENFIAIPGVESAPFYYWTGGVFSNDLTANLWENHISIVGMENPSDYKGLPTLDSNFSTEYFWSFFKGFIFFFLSALVGAVMILWEGYFRIGGIAVLSINLLLMISYHPFRSSPFDQYHGPQGLTPWQLTLDYANSLGAMTFWHHPESSSGIGQKGPISVNTPPHPQDLLLTYGYTGFQAVYEDTITVTEPGREWDQALTQFLRGERKNAVWGIGGHDYHCEGTSNIRLSDVKTIFLVASKTKEGVIAAMRGGKMYAVRQSQQKDYRLSLDEFSVQKADGSEKAIMGDAINVSEKPSIRVRLSTTDRKNHELTLSIIRSGEKIKEATATTPVDFQLEDDYFNPGETVFYRVKAYIHGDNYLIANPIFVLFEGEKESKDAAGSTETPAKAEQPPAAPAESPAGKEGPAKEEKPVEPQTIQEPAVPPLVEEKKKEEAGAAAPAMATAPVQSGIPPLLAAQAEEKAEPKAEKPKEEPAKPEAAQPAAPVGEKETALPKKVEQPSPLPPLKKEETGPKAGDIAPPQPTAPVEGKVEPKAGKPEEYLKKFIIIKNETASLRKGPGVNFEKVGEAKKGDRFELIETSDVLYQKIPWLKVADGKGNSGYIWGGLAVAAQGEKQASPPPAAPDLPAENPDGQAETKQKAPNEKRSFVVISTDDVIIREGPGLNYPQLGTAMKGARFLLVEKIAVFHQGKPWLKVADKEGQEGFVWEALVEISEGKDEGPLSSIMVDVKR
ncbi:MAG: SH3 domain-containing protein [Nitrospinae bacterium]|nr:SH3 domain-containing protein [Nitrospinota bacterium]